MLTSLTLVTHSVQSLVVLADLEMAAHLMVNSPF
jgi:hypothetical protein